MKLPLTSYSRTGGRLQLPILPRGLKGRITLRLEPSLSSGVQDMILGDVIVPGKSLKCDACSFTWVSIASRLPDACPNRDCRSREWNGKKKKRKPALKPRIELPKPKRIRTEELDADF